MQHVTASQSDVAQHPIIQFKELPSAASTITPMQQSCDESLERESPLSQAHRIKDMKFHSQHSAIAIAEAVA